MRRHLTYANVTATLALFLAASTGGAYAAKTLITSKDIKNNSITAADIKDASIGPKDLSSAAKVSGPAGPKGDTGPAGAPGASGALDLKVPGSKISAGRFSMLLPAIATGECQSRVSPSLPLDPGNATIQDDVVLAQPVGGLPFGTTYHVDSSGHREIRVTMCKLTGPEIPAAERQYNWTAIDTK